jgi:subtilase family serine protease
MVIIPLFLIPAHYIQMTIRSSLLFCILISAASAYKPVSPLRRLTLEKTRSTATIVVRAMQQLEAPAEDVSSQNSNQQRNGEIEMYALSTDVLKATTTVVLALTEFLLFFTGKSFKFVSDVLQILFFSPRTSQSVLPSSSLSLSSSSSSVSPSSSSVEKKPLTNEIKFNGDGSFGEPSTSSLPIVSFRDSLNFSASELTNVKKNYWPVKSARAGVVSGSILVDSEYVRKPLRSYSVSKVYWPKSQASIPSPSLVTEEQQPIVIHNMHLETVHVESTDNYSVVPTMKLVGEKVIELGTSNKSNEDAEFAAKLAKANAAAEVSLEQERTAAMVQAASLKTRVFATSATAASSLSLVGESVSSSSVSQPKKIFKKSYRLKGGRRK